MLLFLALQISKKLKRFGNFYCQNSLIWFDNDYIIDLEIVLKDLNP
jgi:hypothetical protein